MGTFPTPSPFSHQQSKVVGVGGEAGEGNKIMRAHQEKISVGGSRVGECVVGITS